MRTITNEVELREIIGSHNNVVASKISDRLNELTRQFIERSPFVCVATKMPNGGIDVSPRGDPPGFVRILGERELLMPERPGNRRVVHHVIAGFDTSGRARAKDAADPKPGYASVGGFGDGVPIRAFLPIWTPGSRPRAAHVAAATAFCSINSPARCRGGSTRTP